MTDIAIVGAGIIGSSWALVFARAGHRVRVFARHSAVRDSLLSRVSAMAERAQPVAPGVRVEEILSRITVTKTLAEAVEGAWWVQESIEEDQEAKGALFVDLDRLAPPGAILASSTSSIGVSRFTAALATRERCLVAHPATPPHLIPVVEVVPAPWTPAEVVDRAFTFLSEVGQRPVLVRREQPGFVMNRLQGALLNEMFRVITDGLMSPEDVDALIRDGFGIRWAFLGPLEGVDLNAPGGIVDYLGRYGFMFDQLARERGATGPSLTAPLVSVLDAAMRARLPLEKLQERTSWRDGNMAKLRQLRRDSGTE